VNDPWPEGRGFGPRLVPPRARGCTDRGGLFETGQKPLSRREQKRARAALEVWDRATRPHGPGRRASPTSVEAAERGRLQAEEDFYQAVSLEELFEKLMQPLSPQGRLWTDAHVDDLLAEFDEQAKVLPKKYARRVRSHVRRHQSRWCAHRVLWTLIEVELHPSTAATLNQVLEVAVERWWAKKREREGTRWSEVRAAQLEREACERWLGEVCSNVPAVVEAVESLLERPRRSSSLVSRLRVLQQVHRKVSDGLLALVAVAWNLEPRQEGKRRGPSPWARWGMEWAKEGRAWWEVVLEEMEREEAKEG